MKWFEHECDSLENPKIKRLMMSHGAKGYVICFGTFEKIGKYGDNKLRLNLKKYPKTLLAEAFSVSIETLDKVWVYMCEEKMLSSKHLKENTLYSPKLRERCDQYHKKIQRKSRQGSDNIPVDKKRREEITLHYAKLKKYNIEDFSPSDYGRIGKAIKTLVKRTDNLELIIKAITWVSKQGYTEWTLETVDKSWLRFVSSKKKVRYE